MSPCVLARGENKWELLSDRCLTPASLALWARHGSTWWLYPLMAKSIRPPTLAPLGPHAPPAIWPGVRSRRARAVRSVGLAQHNHNPGDRMCHLHLAINQVVPLHHSHVGLDMAVPRGYPALWKDLQVQRLRYHLDRTRRSAGVACCCVQRRRPGQ